MRKEGSCLLFWNVHNRNQIMSICVYDYSTRANGPISHQFTVSQTPLTHHHIHIHLCLKIYYAHLSVIYFYYRNLLKSIKFLLNMSYLNKNTYIQCLRICVPYYGLSKAVPVFKKNCHILLITQYIHSAHLKCIGFKAKYLCEAKWYLFYITKRLWSKHQCFQISSLSIIYL
jgi:hypothetical protein